MRKDQGRGKDYFDECLRKLQQQNDKLRRYPQQLLTDVAFDPENAHQQFYRQLQQLSNKSMLLRKLGWKIAELQREQQDLTLFCLGVLSAESIIPLNFFTQRAENGRMNVWVQVGLHLPASSISMNRSSMEGTECKIFKFCQHRLLVLLRKFISENISWGKMINANYSDQEVVKKFKAEIVDIINRDLRSSMESKPK